MVDQPDERISSYARANRIRLNRKGKVGFGNDGDVWATNRNTVIKVFHRLENYSREVACFQRLSELEVKAVDDLSVPRMIHCDDELMIVEMTFVNAPYLLDFGKAYLDDSVPYTPEQLDEWRDSLKRTFRKEDLPRVHRILRILSGYGIHYLDARPWNIRLRSDAEEAQIKDDDWDEDFD